MNRKLRLALVVILSAVLICSTISIVMIQLEYKRADKIYAESRNVHFHLAFEDLNSLQSHTDENGPKYPLKIYDEYFPQAYVDLGVLREINPEVVGWIWIPNTNINFALIRGEDNQKYLSRSYDLEWTNSGSIFLDYRNSPEFSDDNSIIYGHNMKSGGMFGSLKDYADREYLEENQFLYIFSEDKILKYRIFAAYCTESTSESYTQEFTGELTFEAYIDYISASSEENITNLPRDPVPLILLSTCTSNRRTERFVINAAFVAEKILNDVLYGRMNGLLFPYEK